MEPTIILAPWQQYGLVGLMAGAVIALLFIVVKWTLSTTRDILKQAAEERKMSQEQAANERQSWRKAIDEHTAQSKEFHKSVIEAHAFQRKEHEKMIENLEEQGKVLLRINGFRAEEL